MKLVMTPGRDIRNYTLVQLDIALHYIFKCPRYFVVALYDKVRVISETASGLRGANAASEMMPPPINNILLSWCLLFRKRLSLNWWRWDTRIRNDQCWHQRLSLKNWKIKSTWNSYKLAIKYFNGVKMKQRRHGMRSHVTRLTSVTQLIRTGTLCWSSILRKRGKKRNCNQN